MSNKNAKAPVGKAPATQPKAPEKKVWRAEDYATLTIPVEEVKDIKTAFDIFDGDQSGVVDPQELKRAFEQLGFSGQNKFVYQILAELDDDQSGGIDFKEFLRLATAKLSDKDSREEVDKVWKSFDINNAVICFLSREKSPLSNSKKLPRISEKTSMMKKLKRSSSRPTSTTMDLSPPMTSTTSSPTKYIGNNDPVPFIPLIILFIHTIQHYYQIINNHNKFEEKNIVNIFYCSSC